MAWVCYFGNGYQALYRCRGARAECRWEGTALPERRPPEWGGVSRIRVIVDLIEEEFRLEHLPHLSGRDRQALWQRRRRQLFQDEPLVDICPVGRDAGGRRDDRVLFTALRARRILDGWFRTLERWEITVAGLWSLPRMIEGGLLPRWRDGMRVLAYPRGERLALRQNWCRDGRLLFSRLSLLGKDLDVSEAVAEIERTWRYLDRSLPWPQDTARPLQMVAPASLLPSFMAALEERPDLRLGSSPLPQADLPALVAGCLARRFWARPHYRLERRRWPWARLAWVTGLVALVAGVGLGWHFRERQRTLAAGNLNLLQERHRLQERLTRLPPPSGIGGFSAGQIESFMTLHARLGRTRLDPERVLVPVSRVLDAFPGWRLLVLDWHRETAEDGDRDLPAAPVSVTVTLRPPDADFRTLERALARLRRTFRRQPGIGAVEVLESPIPGDDATLTGTLGPAAEAEKPAIVKLRLKLVHPGADESDEAA